MVHKKILITGAGSGIGKDSAIALALRGHEVIAATETDAQAESFRSECAQSGTKLTILTLDITISADREKVRGMNLDVLVNNAGVGETGPLAEVPMDRVRRNFEVNVFATLELSQIVLADMLARKQGTVVFVSSVAGRIPVPFVNPYSMTKFALSGGVAALRTEIKQITDNVHITLIEPGAYATGFNQRMFSKKYEWLDEHSHFYLLLPKLRKDDADFSRIEQKSTESIVRKIVQACEANMPRVRYVAPLYQGVAVYLLRLLGK